MPLPIKSRYTVFEAAKFASAALHEPVTPDQILDWAAQGILKLNLSIAHSYVSSGGARVRQFEDVSFIENCLVEIRPSTEQATVLSNGGRISISSCWRDGVRHDFVRARASYSGGGYVCDDVYLSLDAVAIVGADINAFVLGIQNETNDVVAALAQPQRDSVPAAGEEQSPDEEGLKTREKQIREIESAAKYFAYDVLKIPTGGKTKIMDLCRYAKPLLFGVDVHSFEGAWKEARKQRRVQMADQKKFAP